MQDFKPQDGNSIIYIVSSKLDKTEIYIGKTDRSLLERKEEHETSALKRDGVKFHDALVQTGFSNWEWDVLRECDSDRVLEIEKEYIKQFAYSSVELLNTVHNKKNSDRHAVLKPKIKRPFNPNAESDLYRREAGVLKPVINLTTEKFYRSLAHASETENESKSTIRNSCDTGKMLQNGSRFAWLDLDNKPILKDGHSTNSVIGLSARKVKNLVTDKVFKNANEAADEHNVSHTTISTNASGGSYLVKKKWVFCYLDENGQEVRKDNHTVALQKLEDKDRSSYVAWHINDQKRENLYFFNDLKSLGDSLHLTSTSHVKSVCEGDRTHTEHWRIAFVDEQGNPIFKDKHHEVAKKVIRRVMCLNDDETFENLSLAGMHYQVNSGQIGKCAAGKAKSVRCRGERLRFAYTDPEGEPILTKKHLESLDTRGKFRIYHLNTGETFNSLNAFCRKTRVPIKRAKKFLKGENVDLMGNEFQVIY